MSKEYTLDKSIDIIDKEFPNNPIVLPVNEFLEQNKYALSPLCNNSKKENCDFSQLSPTQSSFSSIHNIVSESPTKYLNDKKDSSFKTLLDRNTTKIQTSPNNLIFTGLNEVQSYLIDQSEIIKVLKNEIGILSTQNHLLTNINEEQTKTLCDMSSAIVVCLNFL